ERAFNVTVDTTAPIINTITSSPEAPKAGDTLTFSITITENFPKTTIIKVNTSTISVLPEHTGTCNAQGLCEVPVSSLLAEFREENLKFIAIDAARNQADKVNEITIFQGDPNNVPAFFRISLRDVVPKKIERQVASQVNVPVFVNLEVETFGSGVVISKGVTCLDSANILSETPFFLSENSDNPIISLKTNTILGSFENDATIICQVALTVRNSTTIFALPELENITIDLELFGSRLGDPNVVAQAQLDNLNQEIKDLEDSIENMEKWVTLFGTWCTIAQTMGQLNSLIQGIKMLMYGVTTGAWFACLGLLVGALPCTKKVEAKWAGAHCLPGGAFHNTVELLFWPSGPISVPTLGLITKYGCMITFHCALCDWTTYLNLAASYVGGALNAGLVGTNGILKPLDRRSALNTATAEDLQKAFDTKTEGSDDIGLEDLNGDPVPVKSVITKDRVTTIQFKDGGKISLAEGEELGLKNEYKFRPGAEGVKTRLEALGEDKKTKFTVKNKDNLLKIDGKSYYVANFHSKDDFFINAADGTTVTSHKNPELYGKLNTKWKATPPPPPGAQKPAPQGILARTNNRIRDTFDKSIKNAWTENLEATRLPEPDPGNWIFDPYKAEIYAMGCLCIPAILHSKQKERQITCLLRNCVTNKLTSSQETTECYDAYDERECLYIESAQVREHGASGIFDNLWEAVKSNLPYLIEGIAYLATCLDYVILSSAPDCAKTYALGVPVAGARPVLCGLWGGSQTIREIISVLGSKFSMNNYNQELKGPDYCTTGGTVEGQ
ncbi:MAG: hypothetical protein O2779_05100, partial [Nanoarchaeota archaeon]|nr:hypothetical protein [Nanoarchaeota archaeon]